MSKNNRSAHGIDLNAPGGLAALFAFHRGQFGHATMSAAPVEGGTAAGSESGEGAAAGGEGAEGAAGAKAPEFPANTAVKDMEPAEQTAYWKHQARKHEDRNKAYGDVTPEALTKLQADAAAHQAALDAKKPDDVKAIEKAREEGRAEARRESAPRLVGAEIKAVAAGRIDAGALGTLIENLNHANFLTDKGEVSTDKVTALINSIAPAGDGKQKFPNLGQGPRDQSKVSKKDAGKAEAARRFSPKK